ncbi:MAG: hypothetical protein V1871_04785 [Planctomycetota bacterium]
MRNRTWLTIIGMVLFVAYVMSFNYGGCGGGGSSGSSTGTTNQLVTTNPAADITLTSATLNGTVNPNGIDTNVRFQYGTTILYGSYTFYQNIGSGTAPVNVSAALTGLLPNTTYNFRIQATTGGTTGIVYNGANRTFTTARLPPICTTDTASNITYNSAILNGTVNPNGIDTTAYFNYGLTTSYTETTTSQSIGSGTSNVSVTANISRLLSNTAYNFRVVGTSNSGTTYGDNLIFTTGAPFGSAPTCTTNPASNSTYNSARLNGTVIPNGLATNAYFQWGLTVSYDNTTTTQAIGNGLTSVLVTANVSGLSSNRGYNFRVVGSSSVGITYGNNLTFNTALPPPTCTTNAATNIGFNSATLNGTVNPNGISTTANFLWGITTSYENTTTQAVGSGTSNVNVTSNINRLSASTLYNFMVVGTNSSGTSYGSNLTFTTSARPLPICTTDAASNIGATSATLNGTVNPNGLDVSSCIFQYGTSESYGSQTNALPYSFSITISVAANINSLSASTLYNFRVVAINAGGTTNGLNRTFTSSVLPPPTCTTNAASNIAATSATLNGTVNPNGVDITSCYFNYGTTQSYGNTANVSSLPGSGSSNVSISANISSLSVNTEYNFRIAATSAGGTTNGLNQTFTTSTQPLPTCTTNAATNVTNNSATLNGTVNPNGLIVSSCIFQYGTSTSYGSQTNASPNSFSVQSDVSANLTSLSASTLYNFRVVATNAGGTTNSSNQTFTTSALPPPTCTTTAATNVTASSATLNGSVNPNSLTVTSSYFDYGTSLSYGSTATTTPAPGSGSSPVSVSANLTSLSASTLYNFRVVAINAGGTTNGSNLTFTTTAVPTTAVDDYVWISNFNSDNVTRITKSTSVTTTITVGTAPFGVAVDDTYVWVANTGSNNVTRITKSTLATTPIAVGNGPLGIAVDETYVWVANGDSNNVTRITKSTLSPYTITVGTNPYGIAVDGTYCWVANQGDNTVTIITKSTLATATIAVGTAPFGVAVDETYCWVANPGSGNVTRIQKSNTAITTTIAVGGTNPGPYGVAVDETYCWVSDPTTNRLNLIRKSDLNVSYFDLGTNDAPIGVAVDGTYAWVVNQGFNDVIRINKSGYNYVFIGVGNYPYSLGDMTGYAYDNYANQ